MKSQTFIIIYVTVVTILLVFCHANTASAEVFQWDDLNNTGVQFIFDDSSREMTFINNTVDDYVCIYRRVASNGTTGDYEAYDTNAGESYTRVMESWEDLTYYPSCDTTWNPRAENDWINWANSSFTYSGNTTAQCDSANYSLCTTENDCEINGHYWSDDDTCYADIQCDSINYITCTTENDCEINGWYWSHDLDTCYATSDTDVVYAINSNTDLILVSILEVKEYMKDQIKYITWLVSFWISAIGIFLFIKFIIWQIF